MVDLEVEFTSDDVIIIFWVIWILQARKPGARATCRLTEPPATFIQSVLTLINTMSPLLFPLIVSTIWLCLNASGFSALTMNIGSPNGSAATPYQKKKVVVLGGGGYLGAMTFGYLQRAASLYGTGIGNVRCIGATSDTSARLNRILSKHFTLAQADESYIKLTDLTSIDAITNRLNGWDAVIFGTDLYMQPRAVTANTYERTPNDKAYVSFLHLPSLLLQCLLNKTSSLACIQLGDLLG
jgi:hypothetical protein